MSQILIAPHQNLRRVMKIIGLKRKCCSLKPWLEQSEEKVHKSGLDVITETRHRHSLSSFGPNGYPKVGSQSIGSEVLSVRMTCLRRPCEQKSSATVEGLHFCYPSLPKGSKWVTYDRCSNLRRLSTAHVQATVVVDKLQEVPGECCNCGCAPSVHRGEYHKQLICCCFRISCFIKKGKTYCLNMLDIDVWAGNPVLFAEKLKFCKWYSNPSWSLSC